MTKYEPINYGIQTSDELASLVDVTENSIYTDEQGKLYIYKNDSWIEYLADTPPVIHSMKNEDFVDESTPINYEHHNPTVYSDVQLDYVINHTQETVSETEPEDNKDEL